jgi:hypothetical protein
MTGVGTGHRMTEVHSGPAAVVADEHERDEPLHDRDSPTTRGGFIGWGPPTAVIHDFETDGVGFGPERHFDGAIGGRRCVGVLLLAASLTARSSSASRDRTNEANQRRTSTRSGASRPGCAGQLRCTNSDDSPCAATGIGSPTSPPHVLTIRIRARTAPRRSDRRFHPCHPDCQPKDIAAGHARPPWSGLGCSPPAGGRAAHPFGAARPSAAPGACGEPWTRKAPRRRVSRLDHAKTGSTRYVAVGLPGMAQQPAKRAPGSGATPQT